MALFTANGTNNCNKITEKTSGLFIQKISPSKNNNQTQIEGTKINLAQEIIKANLKSIFFILIQAKNTQSKNNWNENWSICSH